MTVWTHAILGVLYACVLYFCICTCSAQLSMFHVEGHSRNMLFVITIITNDKTHLHKAYTNQRAVPAYKKIILTPPLLLHHLLGLVVKASVSRAEDPGFKSRLRQDFSGSSHTNDFKIQKYRKESTWH